MEIGYENGATCGRNGCNGEMRSNFEGSCYCNATNNPPCSYCESGHHNELECSDCGETHIIGDDENWQNKTNLKGNEMLKIIRININPEYTNHQGKLTTKTIYSEYIINPLFKCEETKYEAFKAEISPHKELCDTLTEAKQYINQLILNETIECISKVAEIVE